MLSLLREAPVTGRALAVPKPTELSAWSDRKLDTAIDRGVSEAGSHLRNYEFAATVTGLLLHERKRRLKHGDWSPWLEQNFNGHHSTAARYMRMADDLWVAGGAPQTSHGCEVSDADPGPAREPLGDPPDGPEEVDPAEVLPPVARCSRRQGRDRRPCEAPALPGRDMCAGCTAYVAISRFEKASARFERQRRDAIGTLVDAGWSEAGVVRKLREVYAQVKDGA
jgi:Protein of unknown function (DUF3102)